MGSDAVANFFAPGKWIGSADVQAGSAVGLYVIGLYAVPHADGEARTNKVSHIGFDMLRALIVSQAFTQAIKNTVRRDRPTGECCAFPVRSCLGDVRHGGGHRAPLRLSRFRADV